MEISQHAKLNMASFVLYLPQDLDLKCRMVELHPKTKNEIPFAGNGKAGRAMEAAFSEKALSSQQSVFSQNQNQNQNQQQRQNLLTPEQRAEALVRRIGEACDELERLAEENPELVGRVTHGAEEHKEAYLRLKARLALADATPRCRWVRQDGTGCGSPQMKRHIYCFAHKQLAEAQALALMLPALEDANAIQVGLMRIQKALIDDTISTKKAGLLLYSMQLALQNVGRTTFGHVKAEELVRETVDAEEALREKALSSQHSAISQDQTPTTETRRHGEEKRQNQNLFTAKDAEDAKEKDQGLPLINTDDTDKEKGLPLMNADDRGFKGGIRPVEWRPSADMYRMDTREGMEAYEASFRMKIRTSGDLEATSPGAAVPHEHR